MIAIVPSITVVGSFSWSTLARRTDAEKFGGEGSRSGLVLITIISSSRRCSAEGRKQKRQPSHVGVRRPDDPDKRRCWAERAFRAAFYHTEDSVNQKDDIVEIGVVVKPNYPRRIRGAAMSQRNQAQHSDYSYNNDKSVPTSFQRHRLPHHPRERKDQRQQSYIPTIDSVSTGSAPREWPGGRRSDPLRRARGK
jgi:hypothetical protein